MATFIYDDKGRLYKKYVKEWYYECDLNLRGDGKLTQTKLSFPKMTPNDRKMRGGVLMTVLRWEADFARVQRGRLQAVLTMGVLTLGWI